MPLSVPNPRRLALLCALLGFVATPASFSAQAAGGQKPAPKPAPSAPAAPAPKPAAKTAGEAKSTPAPAAPGKGTADRYTATAAGLKGVTGETITIDVIRWSTDAERDKIVAAFNKGQDKEAAPALAAAPNIGYIWRSGSAFGSFIRYATKFKAADGEHVVIATDSDLSSWQGPGTKPGAPFTVLEIVTSGAGVSAGKTSLGGKIIADADSKSLRIDNYGAAAVNLRGVRHAKGS